jgi:hypothetical protein
MKFLLALVAAIAGANATNVRSVECWLNDKCDTTQDHCLKQEYDAGSCYPKVSKQDPDESKLQRNTQSNFRSSFRDKLQIAANLH